MFLLFVLRAMMMNKVASILFCCLLLISTSSAFHSRSASLLQQRQRREGDQAGDLIPSVLVKASLSPSDAGYDKNGSERSSSPNSKRLKSQGPAMVSWDWKRLASEVFRDSDKPIILFDGVCNFCNGGVNLCLDMDTKGRFRFASLQSKVGQALLLSNGKAANDLSSIVLVKSKKSAVFESDAILEIAKELALLPPLVRTLTGVVQGTVPKDFRDEAYHLIANNRYVFGESDGPTCRLDLDGEFTDRFVQDPLPSADEDQEDASAVAL